MSVLSVVDDVLAALTSKEKAQGWDCELPAALLQMKILNRKAMLLLEKKEADVNEQKEKNDSNRLRLENLLYRKAYLAREIKSCKDFTPTEVAAVETEVGKSLIHDSFSEDLAQKHRASLAALAHEYQERQRLQELVAKLKEQHASETGILDKKMKFLEELPSRLDALLAGASDLESVMLPQDQISSKDAHLQRARRLPGPLYTLYHSLHNVRAVVDVDTAVVPGFSLLLARPTGPSSSYGTKWMYKIEVVDGESAPHLELHIRIEVEVPNATSRAVDTDTATMVLRFDEHPDPATRLVGVTTQSLSFHSRCPFKLDGLLHALYPHDEGEAEAEQTAGKGSASGASYYVWLQWLCGLRPVPERSDVSVGNSSGAVLHRIFSRVQSIWRLSTQLHSLESQKKAFPLHPALHVPFMSALNAVPYSSTVLPPPGVCDDRASLYPFPTSMPAVASSKDGPGSVSAASVRSFQRAEAPPLSSFTMDPYRYLREPLADSRSLVVADTAASEQQMECDDDAAATIGFIRTAKDRRFCVYYKIALDLPKELSATPAMALMELSPEYPVRPPQFILTSRISALTTSSKAVGDDNKAGPQIDNALKALECELNAGCLNLLLSSGAPAGASHSSAVIASVEDLMDATLSFQIGMLLSLIVVNSIANSSAGNGVPVGAVPSRKRGRNRRAAVLQGLYGRQPF